MSEVEFKLNVNKLEWNIYQIYTYGGQVKRGMRDEVLELKFIVKV